MMKVAYVFSTSGHSASHNLGEMILPQLDSDSHGADVVGMSSSTIITTFFERAIPWASTFREFLR